jgi:hypothetical protein
VSVAAAKSISGTAEGGESVKKGEERRRVRSSLEETSTPPAMDGAVGFILEVAGKAKTFQAG